MGSEGVLELSARSSLGHLSHDAREDASDKELAMNDLFIISWWDIHPCDDKLYCIEAIWAGSGRRASPAEMKPK